MGQSLEKSLQGPGGEKQVVEAWVDFMGLDEDSFIKEAFVCPPTAPIFSGRLDGLVKTKRGYVIVEFKGFMGHAKAEPASTLM